MQKLVRMFHELDMLAPSAWWIERVPHLGAIAAPPSTLAALLATSSTGMLYHHEGDKLCRWTPDSVARANMRTRYFQPRGWRLVWVRKGPYGDPYEQERARACIFAISGRCVHLEAGAASAFVPSIGKQLGREFCLELASVLDIRTRIASELSDQSVRQMVRKELLDQIQVLQQVSTAAAAAFVESAFPYACSHLESHSLGRVQDFITYQALAATSLPGEAEDNEDSGKPKRRPSPTARPWWETRKTLQLPPLVTGRIEFQHRVSPGILVITMTLLYPDAQCPLQQKYWFTVKGNNPERDRGWKYASLLRTVILPSWREYWITSLLKRCLWKKRN